MTPGEYAVHYSSFEPGTNSPECAILGSLAEAEQYAREQVTLRPSLRCRIYDHQGFIGAPVSEVKGVKYVPESDITPRFRRWGGAILFGGGLILTVVDWSANFKFGWPAMLGTRMLLPGLVLLFIEAMVVMNARQGRRQRRSA
jgi:hypothetical protein